MRTLTDRQIMALATREMEILTLRIGTASLQARDTPDKRERKKWNAITDRLLEDDKVWRLMFEEAGRRERAAEAEAVQERARRVRTEWEANALDGRKIKGYLDNAIMMWRRKRDEVPPDVTTLESVMADYYIDAFQSIRTSLFGTILNPDGEEVVHISPETIFDPADTPWRREVIIPGD